MRGNENILMRRCFWYLYIITTLLSSSTVNANVFSYIKVKKLLTAYAVAKAIGQRRSPTLIPVPIPIPIPIQSNEIIRIPSKSSKTYVTSLSGHSGGQPYGLGSHKNGPSIYTIPGLKNSGTSVINLSSMNQGFNSLSARPQFHRGSFESPVIYQTENILDHERIHPNFVYGGVENYADGYDMDFIPGAYSPNPYQFHKKRRRRRPHPHDRRIRSHKYMYDFPENDEQWEDPLNYKNLPSKSKYSYSGRNRYTGSRRPYSKASYKSKDEPIPVGEVYG